MPTGYTCIVEDKPDVTLNEFAWRCARAFGALVFMRDSGLDAKIPLVSPPLAAEYHRDALTEAEAEYARLMGLTPDEVVAESEAEFMRQNEQHARSVAQAKAAGEGYRRMYDLVLGWQPPTADHAELRQFMLQQLELDLGPRYVSRPPTPLAPEDWLVQSLATASDNIDYHRERLRDEEARASRRTAWLAALNASLPIPESMRGDA